MAEAEDSDVAWGQIWDVQYGLCRHVEERIEKVSDGRSDAFKAALTAYLIEHLSEQLRTYLKLPAKDCRPGDGSGAAPDRDAFA